MSARVARRPGVESGGRRLQWGYCRLGYDRYRVGATDTVAVRSTVAEDYGSYGGCDSQVYGRPENYGNYDRSGPGYCNDDSRTSM